MYAHPQGRTHSCTSVFSPVYVGPCSSATECGSLPTLSFAHVPPICHQMHEPTCAYAAYTREELALSSPSDPGLCSTLNLTLVRKQLLQTFQQMSPGDGSWDLAHPEWLLPHWPLQCTCNRQFPKPKVPETEPRASNGVMGTNIGLSQF